jgi:transposase InsO family protein
MEFITEYLAEADSIAALAERYGISRKTAHYWINQFQAGGVARLAGVSTRPHRSPRATPAAIVAELLAARDRHPTWGAGKLRDWLIRRAPTTPWPCRDTLHTLLVRQGRVRRRRRTSRAAAAHPPLTQPTTPNDVWTVDFKGQFRTTHGALCYPLTVRDGFSRYILRCTALPSVRTADTQPQFLRAFARYGLPRCIRSDNGAPFAAVGLGSLSRLAVWWIRLGIVPERITPGCPGQNGAHEQFHRVLKAETARPPAATLAAQQRRFERFVHEYNTDRPHEALAQHVPPAAVYVASPRAFPGRLPALDYPPGLEVRRVTMCGQIKWQGRALFLTATLAGQDVAFEPIADAQWLVRFATVPLAVFDERQWRVRTADQLLPMSSD